MNDDSEFVPVNGAEVAPEASTQTTEQVTPPAEQPLSLDRVEALLNAREAKLRAEFDERERKMQSKSDKAHAEALRKAKVIEESAELLGLSPEQVRNAKQGLIDREFDTAFTAPEAAPSPQPQHQQSNLNGQEREAEFRAFVKRVYHIDPQEAGLDYRSVMDLDGNDPRVIAFQESAIEAAAEAKKRKANAARVAEQRTANGAIAPLSSGGAPPAHNPVQQINDPDTLREMALDEEWQAFQKRGR